MKKAPRLSRRGFFLLKITLFFVTDTENTSNGEELIF